MTYQLCEKVQYYLYETCKVLSTHAEKKDVLLLTINHMHGRRHVLWWYPYTFCLQLSTTRKRNMWIARVHYWRQIFGGNRIKYDMSPADD